MASEQSLIFSPEMVRALLKGHKTQTRRLLVNSTEHKGPYNPAYLEAHLEAHKNNPGWKEICPYGKIGDHIWVRENYRVIDFMPGGDDGPCGDGHCDMARVQYMDGQEKVFELIVDADMGLDDVAQAKRAMKKKTVPSIHMPRWASRLTLQITDIRIQRLQEIGEHDAEWEGDPKRGLIASENTHTDWFAGLWDRINGKKHPWASNPWVWAISFKVVKP